MERSLALFLDIRGCREDMETTKSGSTTNKNDSTFYSHISSTGHALFLDTFDIFNQAKSNTSTDS